MKHTRTHARHGGQAPLCVTRRFWLYLVLVVVVFISTQMLLSKVSAIFFWFVLLLPIPLLAGVLAARLCIRATMEPSELTVSKKTPCPYQLCIRNRAPLLFPFVEAYASLPQEDHVRCTTRLLRFSLLPLATYRVEDTVSFPFRGTYELGVERLYAYDPFHLFRVCIPVHAGSTVSVLPRIPLWEDIPNDSGMLGAESSRRFRLTADGDEMGENRPYRVGDPLKRIHWKLSSRTEDLIAREPCAGDPEHTLLLCDLSPRFTDTDETDAIGIDSAEDINEYLTDGIVEMTLAYIRDQLAHGHEVELCWFDSRRGGELCSRHLRGTDALQGLLHDFGTAPPAPSAKSLDRLLLAVEGQQDARLVCAIAMPDPATMTRLGTFCDQHSGASGAVSEVLVYEPEARLTSPEQRKHFLESYQEQWATVGVTLTVCRRL